MSDLRRQWRKQYLRYCTAIAMVAPTMKSRIRFNKLKGVRFGAEPWLGVLVYLDIHHSHPDVANSLVCGDHVAIGNGAAIYTHDSLYNQITAGRDPVAFGHVRLGDYVNISPGSFLYNCTIGSHSIVAPHSVVVNAEFPPYSLIAGNPARVVKDLRDHVVAAMGAPAAPVDGGR